MAAIDDQEFLKAKVTDRNPKCGNCNLWGRGQGGIRPCKEPANRLFDGRDPVTTDLSVCSLWQPRE
jgi:hypothetical protein